MKMTCVVCPIGCALDVTVENGAITKVEGNACKRGETYAVAEVFNPSRMLTTTIKLTNGCLVPVKSEYPLPKGKLFECMGTIKKTIISHPLKMGDIVIENINDTGVNIISAGVSEGCYAKL